MIFCVYDCNSQSTGLQSHHFRNLEMFWHLLQGLQYPCLQQRCELNSNRPKATQTIQWHSTHTSWPSVGTSQLFSSNFLRLMWMETQSDLLNSVNVLNLQLQNSGFMEGEGGQDRERRKGTVMGQGMILGRCFDVLSTLIITRNQRNSYHTMIEIYNMRVI